MKHFKPGHKLQNFGNLRLKTGGKICSDAVKHTNLILGFVMTVLRCSMYRLFTKCTSAKNTVPKRLCRSYTHITSLGILVFMYDHVDGLRLHL
jgi:hypothetical protein